jgi:hypothetical protein
MTTFTLLGRRIDLPAMQASSRGATRDVSAWEAGEYLTIRILAPVEAIRVHTNGRTFPGREASGSIGAWVAIGDIIQTSGQFSNSRSLPTANPNSPTAFTHVNAVRIPAGCVINIGITSAKFGGQGGGFQAEYVSGAHLEMIALTGKHWHGRHGVA